MIFHYIQNSNKALIKYKANKTITKKQFKSQTVLTCEVVEKMIQTGGSIGEQNKDAYYHVGSGFGTLVKRDMSKDEATEFAKVRRKRLSPGERSYYGINYRVVPMKNLKKVTV